MERKKPTKIIDKLRSLLFLSVFVSSSRTQYDSNKTKKMDEKSHQIKTIHAVLTKYTHAHTFLIINWTISIVCLCVGFSGWKIFHWNRENKLFLINSCGGISKRKNGVDSNIWIRIVSMRATLRKINNIVHHSNRKWRM